MKNIHLLPSKTPSDLMKCIKSFAFHVGTPGEDIDHKGNFIVGVGHQANKKYFQWHHMYITSNEVAKENDYVLFISLGIVARVPIGGFRGGNTKKKIVSTTDPELIKYGVEKISRTRLKKIVDEGNKLIFDKCDPDTSEELNSINPRQYTEEDLKYILNEALIEYSDYTLADITEWFENIKEIRHAEKRN